MSGMALLSAQLASQCCTYALLGTVVANVAGCTAALTTAAATSCIGKCKPSEEKSRAYTVAAYFVVGGMISTYSFYKLSSIVNNAIFLRDGANFYSKAVGYAGIGTTTLGAVTCWGGCGAFCTIAQIPLTQQEQK